MGVKLFYGNKTPQPITNVSMAVTQDHGLQFEIIPNTPFNVAAGQQVEQRVRVTCLKPYDELPRTSISYTLNGIAHKLDLQFPAIVTKFVSPYAMQTSDFSK